MKISKKQFIDFPNTRISLCLEKEVCSGSDYVDPWEEYILYIRVFDKTTNKIIYEDRVEFSGFPSKFESDNYYDILLNGVSNQPNSIDIESNKDEIIYQFKKIKLKFKLAIKEIEKSFILKFFDLVRNSF